MIAPRYRNDWCAVYEADCREVAAQEEPGSCSLAILDGPYGMGKAEWDKVKIDDLADWYRPHLEDVGRLCAASASMYVWNTAEGWARLDPVIRGMGWTFAGLIIWEKTGAHPARIGAANANRWPDVTEVCGHYTRGAPFHDNQTTGNVWTLAPTTDMRDERLMGSNTARHRVSGAEQSIGLHPCQKPIAFAARILRASSRPGDRVWVPFGGTCREALAATRIGRADPAEARHVVTCEWNRDGVDYLGPAIAQIEGTWDARAAPGQVTMFGRGRA